MKSKFIVICLPAILLCQSAFSNHEWMNEHKYVPLKLFLAGSVLTFIGAHSSLGDGNHWVPVCCNEEEYCVESSSLYCPKNTYLTYTYLGTGWGFKSVVVGVIAGFIGFAGVLYQLEAYLPRFGAEHQW